MPAYVIGYVNDSIYQRQLIRACPTGGGNQSAFSEGGAIPYPHPSYGVIRFAEVVSSELLSVHVEIHIFRKVFSLGN